MFVDVKKLLAVCTILFAFPACGGDPPAPSPLAANQPVASAPPAALASGTMQGGGADRPADPGRSDDEAEQARMIAWEQSFSIEMQRRHEEYLAQPRRGGGEAGEQAAPPAQAEEDAALGVH